MKPIRSLSSSLPRIPWWLGAALVAGVAVFFLWEEHSAHILGAWPLLLLLGCLAMHFFMHRGHGAHRGGGPDSKGEGDDGGEHGGAG